MAGGIPQNLLANLSIYLGIDTKAFNIGSKQAQQQIGGFQKSLSSLKTFMGAAFGAAAIRQILSFANAAKDAYEIQASAETKLETVMRQRMNASDDMIESVKNLTREQQKLGVIGDEVQLSGAQQLTTFLHQKAALTTLIPAMNNLVAQQKGYKATAADAVNVANMMGKVLDGQVGALRRVGISFTDAQEKILKGGNEMERAATLAQVITDNVGEMNKALASTELGRLQNLNNQLSDMNEKLGKKILPGMIAWKKLWMELLGISTKENEKQLSRLQNFNESISKLSKDQLLEKKSFWEQETKVYVSLWDKARKEDDEKNRAYYAEQVTIAKEIIEAINNQIKVLEDTSKVQIPVLEKINNLIEEQTELWKSSVTESELSKRGLRLEQLKEEKKRLEELGKIIKAPETPVFDYAKGMGELGTMKHTAGLPSDIFDIELPDLGNKYQQMIDKADSKIKAIGEKFKNIGENYANALRDGLGSGLEGIGEMIGNAIGGEAINPGTAFLGVIADMANKLGSVAIQTGVATIAINTALKTLVGWPAIAAGVALKVLASSIKSSLGNIASGGSGSVATSSISTGSGNFGTMETTRMINEDYRKQEIIVRGEIAGDVIRLANERAVKQHNRY